MDVELKHPMQGGEDGPFRAHRKVLILPPSSSVSPPAAPVTTGTPDPASVTIDNDRSEERYGRNFMAGLFVGVLLAGAFNPIDKALYLSVVKRRPFLTRNNFNRPFEGLAQAMAQRTLSAGLYYPLYDFWLPVVRRVLSEEDRKQSVLPSIVSGILTGATSGALLNAMSVVKYHNWGSSSYSQYGVFVQAYRMYKKGGIGFFHNGIYATICVSNDVDESLSLVIFVWILTIEGRCLWCNIVSRVERCLDDDTRREAPYLCASFLVQGRSVSWSPMSQRKAVAQ